MSKKVSSVYDLDTIDNKVMELIKKVKVKIIRGKENDL
jgi:thiamine pyrophosphokinase